MINKLQRAIKKKKKKKKKKKEKKKKKKKNKKKKKERKKEKEKNLKKEGKVLNLCNLEIPLCLSRLKTQHSVGEDAGSIPGLTQWV